MTKCLALSVFGLASAIGVAGQSNLQSVTARPDTKVAMQYEPVEWTYKSDRNHADPFNDVDVDVVFTIEGGRQWRIPAFWAGGEEWKVRFAPPEPGSYTFHAESTDKADAGLNGHDGTVRARAYTGANPLLIHGPLRVSANRRYFEFADGTPFFWLADTWWDGFCLRISPDEFKTLAADRHSKGFDVIQIVAGLDPDEEPFDKRGNNEGGYAWQPGFTRINPAYFDAADQRIKMLVDAGLSPAIVGSWGFYLPLMGLENAKKHWRNLIARYGAYPVTWIVTGESGATYWLARHPVEESEFQKKTTGELAAYIHGLDPYGHLVTAHPSYPNSARRELSRDTVLDFNMLQTGHSGWSSATNLVSMVSADYSKIPSMPVIVGENMYEGHRQMNWQDNQRFAFWASVANGAAGYTYGAGGIWQMNGRTVPHGASPTGLTSSITYENTPWDEAMQFPGSRQIGIGKSILLQYPWWRCAPHPEWAEPHGTGFVTPHADWFDLKKQWDEQQGNYLLPYAFGIPRELRFVYVPPAGSFLGPLVTNLEADTSYRASYFDPVTGEQHQLGKLARPVLAAVFSDTGFIPGKSGWVDFGEESTTGTAGGKSTWSVLRDVSATDMLVAVDARSDAEAGILLRFHDPKNSLVAVYSPDLKSIWLHDRRNGEYGPRLGASAVTEIGPDIHLVGEVHGSFVSLTITDGQHTFRTSPVSVSNTAAGTVGVWSEPLECDGNIGGAACRSAYSGTRHDRQHFKQFSASKIVSISEEADSNLVILDAWRAPNLPLMHDWVLVLQNSGR